jgi:phage/plasmid-associated DNA primase
LSSIFPIPENKQLFLEILSGGLTGRPIVIFNGGGRNGKGLLDEFVKIIFGEFGLIHANVSLITEKEKTGANPEKAT